MQSTSDNTIQLKFVSTARDLADSMREFNENALASRNLAGALFRATTFWVFDLENDEFGPSKFVGFSGMTFATYEIAKRERPSVFDGTSTKSAICQALKLSFTPDET
jgi:hypothetical protein